jgi:signal transduction histidine kinase
MASEGFTISAPVMEPGGERAVVLGANGWIAAVLLVGCIAVLQGAPLAWTGAAVSLALIPGLATLFLAPVLDRPWAQACAVFVWIAFAMIGAAATGGLQSPLAACYVAAPALASRLGKPALAAEAAMFSAIGYALAGVASALHPISAPVTMGPPLAAIASIVLAGYWLAAGRALPVARAVGRAAPNLQPPAETGGAVGRASALQAAQISHELRTPLTHIVGFAELMQQRLFGDLHPKYAEYVELILKSARNQQGLIDGLMDLSRLEGGQYRLEPARLDVRALVEEVVNLNTETAAAREISLKARVPAAPLMAEADPQALRQILMNLTSNGVKFTPIGGAVRLSARAEGGELILEASDTGPGIPEEERVRLGAAFSRGAASTGVQGFGLGLSLVRALAKAQNGVLSFHEAPEGGALVRVTLPVLGAP